MSGYVTVDRDHLATVLSLATETDDVDNEEFQALVHCAHILDAYTIGEEQPSPAYFDRLRAHYGRD